MPSCALGYVGWKADLVDQRQNISASGPGALHRPNATTDLPSAEDVRSLHQKAIYILFEVLPNHDSAKACHAHGETPVLLKVGT